MSNQTERKLPSGIVKFTITREELRDILSENYNEDVKGFSVEEEGISISLQVFGRKEKKEELGEEAEKENQMF